jgi:hypothetical protein
MPPPLVLLTGPHAVAYRAFIRLLKADPALKRVVKTWIEYAGDPRLDQIGDTTALAPLVRFIPDEPTWNRYTIGPIALAESPLDITIETAVNGTNYDESANLWAAIHRRMFSQDPVERTLYNTTMAAAGVMNTLVLKPATTINDTGSVFAVASGKVRLEMLISA